MFLKELSGLATLIFGVSLVLVGLTAQVLKNRKEKRCGHPFILALLALLLYVSRAIHALIIKAYYIMVPDLVGIALALVMVYQFIKYKKPAK
jgi:uncharacterized membrane protein YoaK (UPF0700 family)